MMIIATKKLNKSELSLFARVRLLLGRSWCNPATLDLTQDLFYQRSEKNNIESEKDLESF